MYADDLDDYQTERAAGVPPIVGAADLEYQARIDADRVTELWKVALARRAAYRRTDGLPLLSEPERQESLAFGVVEVVPCKP